MDPYQFYRNCNGGGVMLYIIEDIPSRIIEKKFRNNDEYLFVEIDLKRKKWLLCCSYNPHKNSLSTHIDFLKRKLDLHFSNSENFILLRDFNSEIADSNKKVSAIYTSSKTKKEIKKSTCFKPQKIPKLLISY